MRVSWRCRWPVENWPMRSEPAPRESLQPLAALKARRRDGFATTGLAPVVAAKMQLSFSLSLMPAFHRVDHAEHRQIDREQDDADRDGHGDREDRFEHADHEFRLALDLFAQVLADVAGGFRKVAGLFADDHE